MYAQTTFLAASGLGVGITAGARPEGRALARAGACSAVLRRNIDLGALRKFPAAQGSARRGPVPAARAGRTAA